MPATGSLLVAPFSETKAKEEQKKVAKSLQKEVEDKVDLGKGIKMEMVLTPAGKFKTGDTGKDHEITLTKPYYMGKYEVTQEQWESVMGNNPSVRTKGARLPVTDVSWNDCQDFIKKLNQKTKGDYKLPTEAEWEYACRAGTSSAYSYGDSITTRDANYGAISIKVVGSHKPNAFGLYDMHGNVWEWCEDRFDAYPKESVIDPQGSRNDLFGRVLRGGSFTNVKSEARSSNRAYYSPSNQYFNLGLRLARTP